VPGKRQFGSIRRLPSGRWQARYPVGGGRLVAAPRTFATKAEAGRWSAETEADQVRRRWVDPGAGREPLEEYASAWLRSHVRIARRTREIYEGQLRRHVLPKIDERVPALGSVALADITPELVRRWHAALVEHHGQSVAAKAYARLRQVLNQAVDDDRIARSPCRIDGGALERHPEQRFATLGELYRLADVVPVRYRALVLTAGLGGLRQGELFGLRRQDVDLAFGWIVVQRKRLRLASGEVIEDAPKSAAGRRTVALPRPLTDEMSAHLEAFTASDHDAYVFTSVDGLPVQASNFRNRVWLPAVREAGLEGLRFHDLRHTAGTLAAYTGATTKELMARLGHASPRAAMIYQHATADRDRRIAEGLTAMTVEAGLVPTETANDRQSPSRSGTDLARRRSARRPSKRKGPATRTFEVVGTGVDPVTSRFSGARSAN
jgi:integrase